MLNVHKRDGPVRPLALERRIFTFFLRRIICCFPLGRSSWIFFTCSNTLPSDWTHWGGGLKHGRCPWRRRGRTASENVTFL